MKILLLGNYPPDRQESMLRFADLLEHRFASKGHQVRRISPQPWLGRGYPSGLQKWLGYGDKYLVFPFSLQQALGWCDVAHICDHSNAVYTRYLQQVPHVVTCNDLLAIRSALGEFQENPTGWTGRILQRLILSGLNRSQWVACISHHTRQDLMRLSSLSPAQVSVIHMGQNYSYAPIADPSNSLKRLQIPQDRFLIHVGGNQWYKNRLGVLSIFRILKSLAPQALGDLKLVMVGKEFTPEMRAFVAQHQLQDQVLERVFVSNPDLQALYSAATALIFPSLQEGFGWPVIEAQACGCPVVCAKEGPLPEVAGAGALIAPARQEQQLAQHLLTVIQDGSLRADLVQRGLDNTTRFETDDMITAYEQLYEKAHTHFPHTP